MKLDKSYHKSQSFKEASSHQKEYDKMTDEEKTKTWHYLMSVAYGFVGKPWPKMDNSYFRIRKRDEE